jgi:membrane fusion protein (multidrug efflux system)
MKYRVILAIAIVLAVAGGLGAVKVMQIRALIESGKNFKEPPETVSTAEARAEKWEQTITAIGSITPVQGVNIAAEVPGTVVEIAFESGAVVAKGDLIVRLDTSSEEAQLRALEAQTELARLNATRMRDLRAEKAVAQSELDNAESTLKQFEANADAISAIIEKKTIRAPFAGRLGIRQVNLGEYVEAGKTTIVSLQALDKVYAEFSLPQQEVSRIKEGLKVRLATDAYPGREFIGTLSSLNPDLDVATRSVRVQAAFDNAGELLRPGMFARIEVLLPGENEVLVIPATAVLSAPYGDLVYVIQSSTNSPGELVVQQQFVRTGARRGDFISVESGLKAGDRVVRSGMFKLRNGRTVAINNDIVPESDLAPRPTDS